MSIFSVFSIFAALLIFKTNCAISKNLKKLMNDGKLIPTIGLGTYVGTSKNDIAKVTQAVFWAIEAGYRHIDTASLYKDEKEVGQGIVNAIKKGLVKREDLFVTTKLWTDNHRRNKVVPALRNSLKSLNLTYVDLYLIHFPVAQKANGSADDIDYLETWAGMKDAHKLGLTKSIGVSNFNSEQINRIISNSRIKPAVNQIEINPTLSQKPLAAFCQGKNITVIAFSPFGYMVDRPNKPAQTPPPHINDQTLVKIAKKYGKSTTQVVLRYLLDRGLVPIPKSTNETHIKQNIEVFDFHLTNKEIEEIYKFNKNIRSTELKRFKNHPYCPYNKD